MLKKFNSLFKKIIAEEKASSWSEDFVDESKYDFKVDQNGSCVCVFKITRNSDKFTVTVVITDKEKKFVITGEDGKIQELSEKKFAVDYWKDYDDFKKALKKYEKKSEKNLGWNEPESSKIKSFEEVMNDENDRPHKTYDGETSKKKFYIEKLDDEMVDEYCQVMFDTLDEDSNKIFNKALTYCRPGKNFICKIVQFDAEGNKLGVLMPEDFGKIYPEERRDLDKVLVSFSKYLSSNDFLKK